MALYQYTDKKVYPFHNYPKVCLDLYEKRKFLFLKNDEVFFLLIFQILHIINTFLNELLKFFKNQIFQSIYHNQFLGYYYL